ncbi:hypothetical protein [Streptomyces sp. NPDC012746]
MEALHASVERARSPKATGEKAGTSIASRRAGKPAAKKRATTSKDGSLRVLSKAELYKKATAAHVPGRSTMTHDELADALGRKGKS